MKEAREKFLVFLHRPIFNLMCWSEWLGSMVIGAIEIKRPNNAGSGTSMQRRRERGETERMKEQEIESKNRRTREQVHENLEGEAPEKIGSESGNQLPTRSCLRSSPQPYSFL